MFAVAVESVADMVEPGIDPLSYWGLTIYLFIGKIRLQISAPILHDDCEKPWYDSQT
jgi:hypothetical protein